METVRCKSQFVWTVTSIWKWTVVLVM